MNIRNTKGYAIFKAVNGGLFIVFGAAIVVEILRVAGLHFNAVPGLVLGAAMVALGVHRLHLIARARGGMP